MDRSVRFPFPSARYDPQTEAEFRRMLEELLTEQGGTLSLDTLRVDNIEEYTPGSGLTLDTPRGEIAFKLAASNHVTLRVTPVSNTLSFGYKVSGTAFNLDPSGATVVNFADASTAYELDLGVLAPGSAFWVTVWFYAQPGAQGGVSAPVGRKYQPDILDGSVGFTQFASTIRPPRILAVLPVAGDLVGDLVFLTTDFKLYRWTGTVWTVAVPTVDLTGTIATAQIADAAITAAKIGALAVEAGKIAANAVGTAELAALAVSSAKVQDSAISTAKLAANAVTTGKIAALAVTASEIGASAVTNTKIADDSISTPKLQANSIIASKLAVGFGGGGALNEDPNTADVNAWQALGGTAVSVVNLADGKVGVTAFRTGTNDSYIAGKRLIPIDPLKTYRIRGWVRRSAAANGVVYIGAIVEDSAGNNNIGPFGGSYWYPAASGAFPTANVWTECAALIGAGTAWPFGTYGGIGFATMRPLALLNYASSAGYYELQDFRIEEVLPGTLIQDGSISTNKIAANAVTAGKIAADTITATEIAAGAITASEIAALAVTTAKLDANAVTAAKIASHTITAAEIAALTITAAEIAANTITAAKIAAGTITATEIAANTITAAKIAALTITAAEIAALTITAAKIATGTITADKLVANSITAGQIQAGAIGTTELAANAVTATKIAAGTITATQIAAGTITADKISVGTITADRLVINGVDLGTYGFQPSTIASAGPSGTPSNGSLWFQYT